MSIKDNKAVKAGLGYTVGNIFIKGINFITLPLFSRLLTTEEFGIYNVFASYEAILYVIVGFAIHSSIRSANLEFNGQIKKYTASVSLIYLMNTTVMLILAVIFGNQLSQLLDFNKTIIILLIFYSLGSSLLTLYNNLISLEYSYGKYLAASLFNSAGNVLISLVLILTVFKDHGDVGRILGATVTICFLALFLLITIYQQEKPSINKKYWVFAIKYSLPIVPHGISQVLLAQFDRIMIRSMVGNSEAGIYSLAGNIKLILTIITDSISTAWSTWFYEQMSDGKIEQIKKRTKQMSLFFVILTVGLLALSPELILLLGGKAYVSGKYVAIPMIVDAFMLFLYNIIVPAEYYKKKTTYIMFGTLAATVINLITNYIFIEKFGYIAAAYTTLFSYMCYLVLHIIISYRVIGFYILPLKSLILSSGLVFLTAMFDLVFVNSLLIRWGVCAVMVIPLMTYLVYETKVYKKVLYLWKNFD